MNESNNATDAIDVLGSVSFSWLREHGAGAYDESFFMDPRRRLEGEEHVNQIVAEVFPRDPIYNFEASLVQTEGRRRPVALVGGLQPNLILGAAVGAKFVFYGDRDPDITPAPLRESYDLDRLHGIDWRNVWPVSLFLEQVAAMRETLGDRYTLIPPFFWDASGRATFHGILTTAQKLVGERIFIDLVTRPGYVHELFDWIAEAYAELSEMFARAAGLRITGVHIGECSACMVGPQQYEEFILPPLRRLGQRLGPLRLHSCGLSDHLLGQFGTLENLQCLNVGSGTSVRAIRRRFGGLRIDLIPPSGLLTSGAPRDVERWVRQVVDENEAGRLQFQFHLDQGQAAENCLQIIETLRGLGHPCPREPVY